MQNRQLIKRNRRYVYCMRLTDEAVTAEVVTNDIENNDN
jgi:hypothetical protein